MKTSINSVTDSAEKLLRECLSFAKYHEYEPWRHKMDEVAADLVTRITAHLSAHPVTGEGDGWNYDKPTQDGRDARKFVTLKQGGMLWVGIRAWHHAGQYWQNNGEPTQGEIIVAWRELHEPARGFWQNGILHGNTLPAAPMTAASGMDEGE